MQLNTVFGQQQITGVIGGTYIGETQIFGIKSTRNALSRMGSFGCICKSAISTVLSMQDRVKGFMALALHNWV